MEYPFHLELSSDGNCSKRTRINKQDKQGATQVAVVLLQLRVAAKAYSFRYNNPHKK